MAFLTVAEHHLVALVGALRRNLVKILYFLRGEPFEKKDIGNQLSGIDIHHHPKELRVTAKVADRAIIECC